MFVYVTLALKAFTDMQFVWKKAIFHSKLDTLATMTHPPILYVPHQPNYSQFSLYFCLTEIQNYYI